ncbi:unnamed protein product [Notodromas monacha]|uniref:Uncharacterized protein n=1 Tax=Notodromas monacha TaxID=399045 RepID=A0A7R9BR99_9CRUS|nr:unnamed protein product [Notodromas monacha]CAG0920236.1 unnamed protein product [Notodromas monacha]
METIKLFNNVRRAAFFKNKYPLGNTTMRFLLLIFTLALLTPTVLLQDPGAGLSEEMLREAVKQQKASIENKMKKVLDFKTAAGNKSSNSSKTTKPPASKPFQNNSDAETVVYGGTPVTSRTGYQYMARIELAPAAYPSQRINLAAGVIISTSYVLSTAYPFVVIRDSAGSAGSFLYYVVVGDLKSAYIESDEEEFLLAPEEIIVHPEFIDPSKNPLGMTKNNLAIFPLPTSITSTTSSYIEIDISKVSNDLSGYDVDIAGWTMVDPTSSAAGSGEKQSTA